jgi:hypothetical protein
LCNELIFLQMKARRFFYACYNFFVHFHYICDNYFEGAILKINTFLEFMDANFWCSFIYAAENRNYSPRTFKKAVKRFLYTNSFYSLNEYYDNNKF